MASKKTTVAGPHHSLRVGLEPAVVTGIWWGGNQSRDGGCRIRNWRRRVCVTQNPKVVPCGKWGGGSQGHVLTVRRFFFIRALFDSSYRTATEVAPQLPVGGDVCSYCRCVSSVALRRIWNRRRLKLGTVPPLDQLKLALVIERPGDPLFALISGLRDDCAFQQVVPTKHLDNLLANT